MNTSELFKKSILKFYLLVFALSIPFWLIGVMAENLPMVEHLFQRLPMNLPVSSLMAFCPLIAALILVYREDKYGGIKRLLKRVFDQNRIKQKIWYVPIIFLMPIIMLMSYLVMRMMGLPLPEPRIPFLTIPILFVVFFIPAVGEEVGWMGYAIDPMQDRWSALTASIIMGFVWAIWHYPSMIQVGQTPMLMAWGTLGTVGFRILYVWLYNNTGKSIFGVIIFHALSNTGRSVFPGGRSYYELAGGAVGYSIIAIMTVMVAFLWGSKTLARYRFAKAVAEGKES